MNIKLIDNTELPWKNRVIAQNIKNGVHIAGDSGRDWKGDQISAYSNVEDGFLVTSTIVPWEGVTVRTELGLKRAVNKLLKLTREELSK